MLKHGWSTATRYVKYAHSGTVEDIPPRLPALQRSAKEEDTYHESYFLFLRYSVFFLSFFIVHCVETSQFPARPKGSPNPDPCLSCVSVAPPATGDTAGPSAPVESGTICDHPPTQGARVCVLGGRVVRKLFML